MNARNHRVIPMSGGGIASGTRELSAVLFIDLVGYTALAQHDEGRALALLDEFRGIVRAVLKYHHGQEVKSVGDALLIRFGSALDSARFAIRAQRTLFNRNTRQTQSPPMQARIGIHAGEIVLAQGDIYGDVVNIASRVQQVAFPGGICITRAVYDQVRKHWDIAVYPIKQVSLKNVQEPVELFKIEPFGRRVPEAKPAVVGTIALAALGVIGYGILNHRFHNPLRPSEAAPSIFSTPEPVKPDFSAESAPPEEKLPDVKPLDSSAPIEVQVVQLRTQAFTEKYGMPKELKDSLEKIQQSKNDPNVVEEHLALITRLQEELDHDGINVETMPKVVDTLKQAVQKRASAGALAPEIQPLLQQLESGVKDGDLKAANQARKDIEAKLGLPPSATPPAEPRTE